MFNLKPGDIIIVNNWDGNFLSKAIQFFTKSWSHTALGFFPIHRNPLPLQSVFEANLTIEITDWEKVYDDLNYDLRVYRWTRTLPVESVLWELFDKYNGATYGWWQLVYFVWRWVVEKLHLPQRWARKNFFPNREICTEIVYDFLVLLNDSVINVALHKLDRNQNTVHPGDIIEVCEVLCTVGLLERVYNRER